jgi:hypothetical protein
MSEHDHHPPGSVSTQRRASASWARSALTSGMLSLAAIVPAAGVAAEPDTSEEGALGPDPAQDVETDSPNFDPGGATEPTVEVGVQSSPDEPAEIDPLESEPTDDPDSRLAPPPQPEVPLPEEAPVMPPEAVQPGTPPAQGFSIQPPPPPTPQSLGAEPGSRPAPPERLWAVVPVDTRRGQPAPSLPAGDTSTAGGSLHGVTTSAPAAAGLANASRSRVEPPTLDGRRPRVHMVRPGESLWTIAHELLGPDASAMSIAAEVARLWELNQDRISSGDPDLIAVGEWLRLR